MSKKALIKPLRFVIYLYGLSFLIYSVISIPISLISTYILFITNHLDDSNYMNYSQYIHFAILLIVVYVILSTLLKKYFIQKGDVNKTILIYSAVVIIFSLYSWIKLIIQYNSGNAIPLIMSVLFPCINILFVYFLIIYKNNKSLEEHYSEVIENGDLEQDNIVENKDNEKDKNIKIKTITIASDIIFSVLACMSVVPIMFSPMMFDSPGSTGNIGILMAFWSLVTFPFIVMVGVISSIILFVLGKNKNSLILSLLPSINVALFIIGLVLWEILI